MPQQTRIILAARKQLRGGKALINLENGDKICSVAKAEES